MPQLINLLIYAVLFSIVAYSLWGVCTYFGMPAPVMWICGAILLLMILYFVSSQLGLSTGTALRR